jgi:hypothetical protein
MTDVEILKAIFNEAGTMRNCFNNYSAIDDIAKIGLILEAELKFRRIIDLVMISRNDEIVRMLRG